MSYTPTNWKTGDVVTSEKLNHLENGIADADGMMVINDNNGTLDKTWQEIYDAFIACGCIIHKSIASPIGTEEQSCSVVSVNMNPIPDGTEYCVSDYQNSYMCASPNDYPSNSSYE